MKCELCPLQTYCPVLEDYKQGSRHPDPTHIPDYCNSNCPLWKLAIEGRNPSTGNFLADRVPKDE